jgi:hypothetical protein
VRAGLCGALALLATQGPALSLEIGAVAPEFGMTTVDGRRFSLSEAEKAHSGVVILFLSTICLTGASGFPVLVRIPCSRSG